MENAGENHSNAEVGSGRSLKYWTTFDEANGISTVDDYMKQMALLSNWGARDNVSIAKIPAGTKIKYEIGTAKEQVGAIESRPGGGLQILFEQFDDGWVLDAGWEQAVRASRMARFVSGRDLIIAINVVFRKYMRFFREGQPETTGCRKSPPP